MNKIRSALIAAVKPILQAAPIGLVDTAIIAANMPKPKAAKWAQLFFKPNQPLPHTLGPGGLDVVTGVLLINMHYPLDTGDAEGISALEAIRIALTAGMRLNFSGQEVIIASVGGNIGRIVDTWSRTDVSVIWRSYLQRGAA